MIFHLSKKQILYFSSYSYFLLENIARVKRILINLNTSQKILVILHHQENRLLMINDCIGKEGLCFEHLLCYKTSKDSIRTIAECAGRSVVSSNHTRTYLRALHMLFFISDQKWNIDEISRLELSNPIFLTLADDSILHGCLGYEFSTFQTFSLQMKCHKLLAFAILMENIEKVIWFIPPVHTSPYHVPIERIVRIPIAFHW